MGHLYPIHRLSAVSSHSACEPWISCSRSPLRHSSKAPAIPEAPRPSLDQYPVDRYARGIRGHPSVHTVVLPTPCQRHTAIRRKMAGRRWKRLDPPLALPWHRTGALPPPSPRREAGGTKEAHERDEGASHRLMPGAGRPLRTPQTPRSQRTTT